MRSWLVAVAVYFVAARLLVWRPMAWRDPSVVGSDRPEPVRSATPLPRRGRRRSRWAGRSSGREPAPPADLSTSIDLLAVAVSAGLALGPAITAVGASGDGPTARALRRADVELSRGAPLADVLGGFGERIGPVAQPIVASLIASVSSGEPAGPALRGIAQQERRRARRRIEARVRRLPALLAIPLTLLVLPAFVVITLVPVGVTAAEDLRFPATSPTRWSPP